MDTEATDTPTPPDEPPESVVEPVLWMPPTRLVGGTRGIPVVVRVPREAHHWGRCVFAEADILEGTEIFRDPCLRVRGVDAELVDKTGLWLHVFQSPNDNDIYLPCGLSALLAHSDNPNCLVEVSSDTSMCTVHADRRILAGEMLTHDYNRHFDWFHPEAEAHD